MPQFSRMTIIEVLNSLEKLSHAEIDRFLLKFGLEEVASQSLGSKTHRVNALIKYLIDNPNEKGPLGSNLTFEIIEAVIELWSPDSYYSRFGDEQLRRWRNPLKRDGYIIVDGKLKAMLPEDIRLAEKENELNSLLDKSEFVTAKGHLQQAISAHTRGDWASANAQIRSFVEALFDSIADKLVSDKRTLPAPGYQRREFLAKLSPPFLSGDLNEWQPGGNTGFLQGFWRRLHPQGSHPGLSDEEDSTFRLHLTILIASHYLRRLDTRLGDP